MTRVIMLMMGNLVLTQSRWYFLMRGEYPSLPAVGPVHCTLYTVHCTLYTVHCPLYTVHCTLYTVHCTLYTVHCTLYVEYQHPHYMLAMLSPHRTLYHKHKLHDSAKPKTSSTLCDALFMCWSLVVDGVVFDKREQSRPITDSLKFSVIKPNTMF